MKKFILLVIMSIFIPLSVNAVDYDITDFIVDSYIQENGDIRVSELIVLDGDFNGYERDLLYKNDKDTSRLYNASDITDLSIRAKHVDSVSFETFADNNFTKFNEVLSANKGDKGKYVLTKINDGYRVRMYYRTDYDKTAFNINYTVKDAAILHNDIGEINWSFIPNGFEDKLNNIDVRVHLPRMDSSKYLRVWAYGNLNGNIKLIKNEGANATISDVIPGESVGIRVTFDKSLLDSSLVNKKTNRNEFNRILNEEEVRADSVNKLRDKIKAKYYFTVYLSWFMLIGLIVSFIICYLKYGKSPKSGFDLDYYREINDGYNVEDIDYLMNRKITPNAMSASIMNLIYKKNISATEIIDTNSKSKKKSSKNYNFVLEDDNLEGSEKVLIEFLFDNIGKGKLNENGKKFFTTMMLKDYASNTKTCSKFLTNFTNWKKSVITDANKHHFFEESIVPKVIGTITLIISLGYFALCNSIGSNYALIYVNSILGLIIFFIEVSLYKYTSKGSLDKDQWTAFKHFLDDFGSYELKDLPEIVLWEKYLVYATIFGLADKVQESMNVKIKEIDPDAVGYDYVRYNTFSDINTCVNNSINNSISRATSASYENANSSYSSGSGYGGGFSGDGGCSGGGGGGRGF